MARNGDARAPDAPSPSAESTQSQRPRRGSFSFLHRSKSTERMREGEPSRSDSRRSNSGKRSFSGGNKLVKKQIQREVEAVLRQAREDIPEVPPIIPSITHQPSMQTFGGESARVQTISDHARTRSGSNSYAKPSFDVGRSSNGVPIPPMPTADRSESVDPYARTESMTHRGRFSYASSFVSTTNGPRRVRRRKDPTPFNVLVLGATNAGKTSFIDFLQSSCALPAKKQHHSISRPATAHDDEIPKQTSISSAFQYHYLETEMSDGERIGLTLWDSESLEKNIVDLQLRDITAFIESKFEETYSEENKLMRSPGVRDTHIHCTFLLLDPLRLDLTMAAAKKALLRSDPAANGKTTRTKDNNPLIEAKILDEALDIQVLRVLKGKTAVIPVISKADTVTSAHMRVLKRSVWSVLKSKGLDPLESIGLELEESSEDEDEDSDEFESADERQIADGSDHRDVQQGAKLGVSNSRGHSVSPARSTKTEDSDLVDKNSPNIRKAADVEALPPLPLSILTPDPPDIHHNESEKMPGNVGRAFPWGFADPYDPTHCDFTRLKKTVLSDWRAELREKSRDMWYENWRTARLKNSRQPPSNRQPQIKDSPSRNLHSSHGRSSAAPAVNPPRGLLAATAAPPMPNHTAGVPLPQREGDPVAHRAVRDGDSAVGGSALTSHRTNSSSMNAHPSGHYVPPNRYASSHGPGWRSASAQRAPMSASQHRRPTNSSGGYGYVTALPPVNADEVGVAR